MWIGGWPRFFAQMVTGRRAVPEAAEPAQQRQLLAAEPGDIDNGLGARQHGEQAEQENLVERVGDLPLLARVFQVLEMTQKNHRLVPGSTICRYLVHGCPPQANRGLPWTQHFIGLSPTPSPDCPAPIPGLYAAGEILGGLYFHNYGSGTGLVAGVVFGRIAGSQAADFALTPQ
ncbi:MAG TPA: hypothetical protein VKI44_27425 [Acetobacteraceae bacterium]|nr:hypothetical protein [Acetobacteraceae bacterium]